MNLAAALGDPRQNTRVPGVPVLTQNNFPFLKRGLPNTEVLHMIYQPNPFKIKEE